MALDRNLLRDLIGSGVADVNEFLGGVLPIPPRIADQRKLQELLRFQQAGPEIQHHLTTEAVLSGKPLPLGATRRGEIGGLPRLQTRRGNQLLTQILMQQQLDPLERQQLQLGELQLQQAQQPGLLSQSEKRQAALVKAGLQPKALAPSVDRIKADAIQRKQRGLPAPGFENLSIEEIAKLDATQINNILSPGSAAERTKLAETQATLDRLDELNVLREKAITGPVVGRATQFGGLFGMTSEDQENFLAATAALKNQVIKDITGAQMSEAEANRILKQVPTENDPPKRWRAKMAQTKKNLQLLQARRKEVLKTSGLRAPEFQQAEPTATNPQTGERLVFRNGQWQPIR